MTNTNRSRVEPYSNLADVAFTEYQNYLTHKMDSFGQRENEYITEQEKQNTDQLLNEEDRKNHTIG